MTAGARRKSNLESVAKMRQMFPGDMTYTVVRVQFELFVLHSSPAECKISNFANYDARPEYRSSYNASRAWPGQRK